MYEPDEQEQIAALHEVVREQSVEIEQWRSAARELVNGSDRKTGSAGQVYVDEGSLMALKRLLPTKDTT